jgi:integrase
LKPKGRHPHKRLKPIGISKKTKPGRYADGGGLYLVVDPSGAKRWVLRVVVHGKRRDMGLGGVLNVSLVEARDLADKYRKIARAGSDPFLEKKREDVPTFEEAAKHVYAQRVASWRNEKHREQWLGSLKSFAFPIIGSIRVSHIDSSHVLNVLSPIWLRKPETARRVRQRIGTVLKWATAARHRSGENPVNGIEEALPDQPNNKEHHEALPYADVPTFIGELRRSKLREGSKLGLEMLILTATRTGELVSAEWLEFDLDDAVWTIPAVRMKAKKSHQVPLSPRCIEILRRAKEIGRGSKYVFPSRNPEKPLSNMVFLMGLRRMQKTFTAHGFRSSFRDWAAEKTNFPNAVCEAALAHTVKDKVEAAYLRTRFFDLRRELMNTWAGFVATTPGRVVQLSATHR